jgi:hypothetical protein
MQMACLISVMVLAGGFVIASGPGTARADSQAGGVPVVADRVSVLEGVATTLQTAVTALTTQVTTLRTTVTTLQTDNTDLRAALAAEIAARGAGDDAVRALVFQEALDRLKVDVNLTNRMQAVEALAGAGATGKFFDVHISDAFLVNGARATVATVGPLPPGNYLVVGRVEVENFIHDTLWFCNLLNPAGFNIDGTATSTQSVGFTGNALSSLTMAGIARLTAAGPVTLECESNESGSDLPNVHLLAVQIGQPG